MQVICTKFKLFSFLLNHMRCKYLQQVIFYVKAKSMKTAFLTHPHFLLHQSARPHPERPQRLAAIARAIENSDLNQHLLHPDFQAAPIETLQLCHSARLMETVRLMSENERDIDGDTYTNRHSYEVARLASGAACAAVEMILQGECDNAFVASRPPGHHAESARAMGFCLFNHAANAARWAQKNGVERVAIVDWDVHHGNGTQEIFYADGSVFFASLHESPLYPGTGAREETGLGAGIGTTMNVPLRAGCGDAEYLAAWQALRAPLAEFAPQLMIVSAGFDAHRDDPLGHMNVSAEGFAAMMRETKNWARELCDGHVLAILEGGYDLDGLADSVVAVLNEITRDEETA